jgi:hypothetical protein
MSVGKGTPKGVESGLKRCRRLLPVFSRSRPVYNCYSTYRLFAVVGSAGQLAAGYARPMSFFILWLSIRLPYGISPPLDRFHTSLYLYRFELRGAVPCPRLGWKGVKFARVIISQNCVIIYVSPWFKPQKTNSPVLRETSAGGFFCFLGSKKALSLVARCSVYTIHLAMCLSTPCQPRKGFAL